MGAVVSSDILLAQVEAEKECEFAAALLTAAMEDHTDLLSAIKKARFHLDIAERKTRVVNAELHEARVGRRA